MSLLKKTTVALLIIIKSLYGSGSQEQVLVDKEIKEIMQSGRTCVALHFARPGVRIEVGSIEDFNVHINDDEIQSGMTKADQFSVASLLQLRKIPHALLYFPPDKDGRRVCSVKSLNNSGPLFKRAVDEYFRVIKPDMEERLPERINEYIKEEDWDGLRIYASSIGLRIFYNYNRSS